MVFVGEFLIRQHYDTEIYVRYSRARNKSIPTLVNAFRKAHGASFSL
jgi:hypothetical protein